MKKLIYLFLTVLIVGCSGEDDRNSNYLGTCDLNVVYLADNGITIKACEDANVGDMGVIDGVTYTVVNDAMLRDMVANGEDVTKVATTKVTDMSQLFKDAISFNQSIGNWDVYNVETFAYMFWGATSFNQPIGDWGFGYCENFKGMFHEATSFNQDISSWVVGSYAPGVQSRTDVSFMFWNATSFNQDISSWPVLRINKMHGMFWGATSFNQPLGNWNLRGQQGLYDGVYDVRKMFKNATSFNQDLSSWDTSNVDYCEEFSYGATSWTLPKPNFSCND